MLNPASTLRLNEFGINLPSYEEVEGLTVSEILTRFTTELTKAKDFKGWSLEPEVHLATFSFAKEAMYKDLLDNEATIIEHPVIQALANSDPTSQSDEFQFDPVDPADIDEVAPRRTPLVLDADSSQRAAVVAALAGRSFVMDGPPGTGKSQTIANMIGALAARRQVRTLRLRENRRTRCGEEPTQRQRSRELPARAALPQDEPQGCRIRTPPDPRQRRSATPRDERPLSLSP